MKYILALVTFNIAIINLSIAEIGNFLLMGSTTKSYLDSKYVSFKDKNGHEYKIPRKILTQDQNSKLSKEQVVLYKEISPESYLTYRKECKKYFKDENKKITKVSKNRSLASDKLRSCL